jgi:hypothetical protein
MILRVERDSVEFFVDTITGLTGISISGLARLCGVSQVAITRLLQRLESLITKNAQATPEANPSKPKTLITKNGESVATKNGEAVVHKNAAESLEGKPGSAKTVVHKNQSEKKRGKGRPAKTEEDLPESLLSLLAEEIYMTVGSEYKNASVILDRAVSKIIEYYSLDAEETTKEAKHAMRQFNQMGVRNWIYDITDWRPVPVKVIAPRTRAEELGIEPRYIRAEFDRYITYNILTDPKITAPMYRLYFCFLDCEIADEQLDIPTLCERARVAQKGLHNLIDRMDQHNMVPDWFELDDSTKGVEAQIRDRLQAELGGEIEVSTLHGAIDLLTATELIEVNRIDHWQKGFGQILSKTTAYPQHQKRLHLFGTSQRNFRNISACCAEFDIEVSFEMVPELSQVTF